MFHVISSFSPPQVPCLVLRRDRRVMLVGDLSGADFGCDARLYLCRVGLHGHLQRGQLVRVCPQAIRRAEGRRRVLDALIRVSRQYTAIWRDRVRSEDNWGWSHGRFRQLPRDGRRSHFFQTAVHTSFCLCIHSSDRSHVGPSQPSLILLDHLALPVMVRHLEALRLHDSHLPLVAL